MNATILQKIFLSIAFLANLFIVLMIVNGIPFKEVCLTAVIINFILYVFYKIWGEPKK